MLKQVYILIKQIHLVSLCACHFPDDFSFFQISNKFIGAHIGFPDNARNYPGINNLITSMSFTCQGRLMSRGKKAL